MEFQKFQKSKGFPFRQIESFNPKVMHTLFFLIKLSADIRII